MWKLKNGKAAGKDEIRGERIKGGGDKGVDWIWRLCNMAFESGVVSEEWKSAVIVPMNKNKGERIECKNYRCTSLLRVVGKIYAGILVDRIRRVIEGLLNDEQRGFKAGRGVDQIFTLKQIGEIAREKKRRVNVGFIDLERCMIGLIGKLRGKC